MTDPQNRPAIGRKCRSEAAALAGSGGASAAARPAFSTRRQLPLFAQFPPAALFTAIGRAVARRTSAPPTASGTDLATRRLQRLDEAT